MRIYQEGSYRRFSCFYASIDHLPSARLMFPSVRHETKDVVRLRMRFLRFVPPLDNVINDGNLRLYKSVGGLATQTHANQTGTD